MIEDFKVIEELFNEINKMMHKKVYLYIIGGAALLQRGMKDATKDIDIVVETKQDFIEFQKVLEEFGFTPQIPGKEYTHMNLSQIFQKSDFRIDLFEKEVCGRFSLSQDMTKRANNVIDLNYISISLCSNEDIFLFKTMTERDGDIDDCISIATLKDPDWKIIIEELKNQIHNSKQDVWLTWVGERLDILKDKGLIIPVMDEVDKLRNKFFDNLEKR